MKIKDIRFGDIVTYRSGRINHVNNPYNYQRNTLIPRQKHESQ